MPSPAKMQRNTRTSSGMQWTVVVGATVTMLVGCRGTTTVAVRGDVGAPIDGAVARVPTAHRATSSACPGTELPPEPVLSDGGASLSPSFVCRVHEDCTLRPGGRCIIVQTEPPGQVAGTRCVYNDCYADIDCAKLGVCTCGNVVNVCLAGSCRVDADCGAGGFCSPSEDPCLSEITGYHCHTSADECVNDTDCTARPSQGRPSCQFDSALAYWACSQAACASGG